MRSLLPVALCALVVAASLCAVDGGQCEGGTCASSEEEKYMGVEVTFDTYSVMAQVLRKDLAELSPTELRRRYNAYTMTSVREGDTCELHGWRAREFPRRVWDAFTLFNEMDMLELRLKTLDGVVDAFVIAEATKTFTNLPKPLHFEQNKERFASYLHKIAYLVVDDLPDDDDAWVLEHFQRNALERVLMRAAPHDLIIIADLDEIPDPLAVSLLAKCDGWDTAGAAHFYTLFYNFRFEFIFEKLWRHPQACERHLLDRHTPMHIRFMLQTPTTLRFEEAGWHLSFFADAKGIAEKIKAYPHQEFNKPHIVNESSIAEAVAGGVDYFYDVHRDGQRLFGALMRNPSCHGLPEPVLEDRERWAQWLPDCDAAHVD